MWIVLALRKLYKLFNTFIKIYKNTIINQKTVDDFKIVGIGTFSKTKLIKTRVEKNASSNKKTKHF